MTSDTSTLYCINHPNVETTLRCNRCEMPICPKCAVSTPTGYRCRDCVRGQQKVFETALWYDFLLAFGIASILSYIGSQIVPALGFFTILLSPIAGFVIAEAIRFIVRRRRSRRLFQITAVGAAIGSLPPLLLVVFSTLVFLPSGNLGSFWGLLWHGFYTVTITTTVYYRLSGINVSI